MVRPLKKSLSSLNSLGKETVSNIFRLKRSVMVIVIREKAKNKITLFLSNKGTNNVHFLLNQ